MENIVQIVLAVAGSVILVMLAVAIYNTFVPNRNNEQGVTSLESLVSRLEEVETQIMEGEYLALNFHKRYLFAPQTSPYCSSDFCLCLVCDDLNCRSFEEDVRESCVPTEKLVVFEQPSSDAPTYYRRQYFQEDQIKELSLRYVPGLVYSYNVHGTSAISGTYSGLSDNRYQAYFYRYEGDASQWLVSTDLLSWKEFDKVGIDLENEQGAVFEVLDGVTEERGRLYFLANEIKVSNGVYVISQ